MYVLTKVNSLPQKKGSMGKRDTEVFDALYEFLAKDFEYARVDDILNKHANGNNLRRHFQWAIREDELEDVVEATIRGNTVYLRRKYE